MYDFAASPSLKNCVKQLHSGCLIAYPTEAVWGLGCDPNNVHALRGILEIKKRPIEKGLILVAADIQQFRFLLRDLTQTELQTLSETWPGHSTWLVPHKQRVSIYVSGAHQTVAIRVSAHPIVQQLCRQFGGPIVSTSANPQGLAPASSAMRARRYFQTQDLTYAPGCVGKADAPSVIRDLKTNSIIRA